MGLSVCMPPPPENHEPLGFSLAGCNARSARLLYWPEAVRGYKRREGFRAVRVALFIPCYVDLINPEVGVSVVRILRRLGVEVVYPEGQTCCGQPAFNSGYFDEARAIGRHFLDVFERERFDYIVCPSGSCTTMVSHYYPFVFEDRALPDERERAEALGHRVREFSDFVVNVLGVKDLGAGYAGRAVFHTGCHQRRELGILNEPRDLLRCVSGLELLEWENEELCCGFGAMFSVKMPDVSTAMADEKIAALEKDRKSVV